MGQYREWLLAQEIDRRLQKEARALETELFDLRQRVSTFEQTRPDTENIILLALLAYLADQETPAQDEATTPPSPGWSGLLGLKTPQSPAAFSALSASLPQTEPVSEELPTLFTTRQPVTELAVDSEHPSPVHDTLAREPEDHSVEAETRRLNENIQRWFERWHQKEDPSNTTLHAEVPYEQ